MLEGKICSLRRTFTTILSASFSGVPSRVRPWLKLAETLLWLWQENGSRRRLLRQAEGDRCS
jgi:hypothetical protein